MIGNDSNGWLNTGDKSPMCRVNEMARFNDIRHEYHLIEELGPPHNKTFTVVLKLGDSEEFRGTGPSIKKAQRCAATVALQETSLRQPTPRMPRHTKNVWTPTVQLNMLAMKLGQNAVYQVYEPPKPQPLTFGQLSSTGTATNAYDFRGMHFQRYHMPRGPFSASLSVGDRQFLGKGYTAQAARHAAAEEALKVLKQLAISEPTASATASPAATASGLDISSVAECSATDGSNSENSLKSPVSLVHELALKRNLAVRFEVVEESGPSHMPRFVTQCVVGHIVTTGEGNCKKMSKKNAAIRMVGELNKLEPLLTSDKCEANKEGAGDQNTPKRPAIRMASRKHFSKKKTNNNNVYTKNINKENGKRLSQSGDRNGETAAISKQIICDSNDSNSEAIASNSSAVGSGDSECQPLDLNKSVMTGNDLIDGMPIHPINRLMQLQQARKEKAPQFTLLSERVIDIRHREFTIECTIYVTKGPNAPQTVSAVGLGPNKKVAKKNAADQMLQLLGYSSRAQPHSILKQDSTDGQSSQHKKIRQVKFIEDNSSTVAASVLDMNCGTHLPKLGRQLVPGLILMPSDMSVNTGLKNGSNLGDSHTSNTDSFSICSEFDCNPKSKSTIENISKKIQTVSTIAKQLLESKVVICTKKSQNEDNNQSSPDLMSVRSDQLESVSKSVGTHQLQVHFSDFPRKQSNGGSTEYLSVVTITMVWNQTPIVSHGSGQTVNEARNQASHQALIQLSQLESSHSSS